MYTHKSSFKAQSGMMLLEGLLAILVFSLGILALVGMQAVAVKQVTDAKYRSDASLLAGQLLGTMWTKLDRTGNDPDAALAKLKQDFDTEETGSQYLTDWKAAVVAALPGVTDEIYPPIVHVDDKGMVTMSVRWVVPGDANPVVHQYVTVAQIR